MKHPLAVVLAVGRDLQAARRGSRDAAAASPHTERPTAAARTIRAAQRWANMLGLLIVMSIFVAGFGAGFGTRSLISHRRRLRDTPLDQGHW